MDRAVTVLLFLRRVDCNDGVASYCETVIRGLTARGYRVVVVSGPVSQLYGSEVRHDVIMKHVLEWVVIDDLMSARPKLSTIRAVLATMRKHSVDVISPQGFSLMPFSFLLSRLARRPVVANYLPSMPGTSAPRAIATSRSQRMKLRYRAIATLFRADRFIAMSKEIVAFYRGDCRISADRVAYIPLGIDTSFFRPPSSAERAGARRDLSLPDDALVCVLPGRLNFDKGHDVVIDAVRMLRESNPHLNVVCLFPGGGDQAEDIRTYAFETEKDREAFRFLGFLDADAFRQVYWAADVVLLPSRFEGFGLVIAEAMSCGCVPIRTPSGGSEDQIIDGVNGFVVPFNDPRALADRIAALSDDAARTAMRENAMRHATQHFDQESMVAATADLYREAARR
jgi:glycosyltransferase involved in cell wall biosynthesis